MSDPIYVEKSHYDNLFSAYSDAMNENVHLKKAWDELKDRFKRINSSVLLDVYDFETIDEQRAYLIGAFNMLESVELDMNEMEGNINAENCKQ